MDWNQLETSSTTDMVSGGVVKRLGSVGILNRKAHMWCLHVGCASSQYGELVKQKRPELPGHLWPSLVSHTVSLLLYFVDQNS